MKSILDRSFRYTKSADTDLRKTFARVRREQRREQGGGEGTGPQKVVPIGHRKHVNAP